MTAIITGHHYQNAYIVRDIDKAVEAFCSKADVRLKMQTEVTQELQLFGKPASLSNKLAFLWVDDMQVELIEPSGGDDAIYRDAMPADDSMAFHHICFRVPDWNSFRADAESCGFPIALEGGSDALRYLYLDAREMLGHFIEYTWMNDERWGQLGGR